MAQKEITPKNHIPTNMYIMPRYANTVMTRKEFKETLKATDGRILTAGYMWDIIGKAIGAGMYRVTLKIMNP